MATSSCATKVILSLISDQKGDIVSESVAKAGAADKKDTNIYICVESSDGTVTCIRRPGEGNPVRIKV